MAVIARVRVALTGRVGLPGVCTFYCTEPITFTAALDGFWTAMAGMFPESMVATIENEGDFIDDTNGKITDSWTGGGGHVHNSANGTVAYSAPSGAAVTWLTEHIVNGHRSKGRTFIVPLWGNAYEGDGTLSAATLTNIRTAAGVLWAVNANNMLVWSRPFAGRAAVGTKLAIPARLGSSAPVTGSRVTDKVAVLRSRRD